MLPYSVYNVVYGCPTNKLTGLRYHWGRHECVGGWCEGSDEEVVEEVGAKVAAYGNVLVEHRSFLIIP